MACGEFGPGRLPGPQDILDQLSAHKILPRGAAAGEGDRPKGGGGG
jgi:hypothetical protein